MATEEALKAIQEAAFAIQTDRKRLNDAFQSLRAAAKSLNPGVELLDDGSIIDKTKPVGEQVAPIWDVVREAEPDVEPEPIEPELDLRTMVEQFILKTSPTRPSALDKEFISSGWSIPEINAAVQGLARDKVVKRTSAGHWVHKDYSPKVTEPPPQDPTRGSGLRKDTLPGATTTGTTSTRVEPSQPSPKPAAKSSAVPKTRPATSDSTSSLPDSAKNPDGTYGVTHAAKPFGEMKTQQREAEERLATIIAWAEGQGDKFDVLTAAKDLANETSIKHTSTKSLYLASFRTLAERGVFKHTGREIQPDWKPKTKSMGRGTKEYTWGPNSPKAEPTPATTVPVSVASGLRKLRTPSLEEVRDVAVDLKQVSVDTLMQKLDVQNTRAQRHAVREHMATLAMKKMFAVVEGGWEYIPPTDAGAAAMVDLARRPAPVERASASAVTGTGRGKRAGDPEVQRIVDAAKKKNWGVEFLSKHIRIKLPTGDSIIIAHTPNQRGLLRDKARLRKAGLALG